EAADLVIQLDRDRGEDLSAALRGVMADGEQEAMVRARASASLVRLGQTGTAVRTSLLELARADDAAAGWVAVQALASLPESGEAEGALAEFALRADVAAGMLFECA